MNILWNIGLFHLHLLSKLYCLVTARFFLSKPSPQEEEINCQLSSHLSWAFFSINLFIVCLVFLYKVKGNFAHLSQAKLLLFICLLLYLLPERFSLKLLHDTKEPVKIHSNLSPSKLKGKIRWAKNFVSPSKVQALFITFELFIAALSSDVAHICRPYSSHPMYNIN